MDSLVGRTLEGRYRLLERIARGGMSTVYAAVDERLDRLVAVKVMASALSADPAFSDRFAREARAAARLTHLNVVSVYDQGNEIAPDGHHVFLVMELVEGRTLRELLRERGRLNPAEAVSIMEPVLSALSAAHHAGIVHRDVKPENILLSDEGVVKVADFGLARAVETDPTSTRTGLMMGTIAYCAPEQIARGEADPRSDVYSAGIVLFELLTGTSPYRGDSAINIAYQHVHSRVPAPSSRVKGTPMELDELVVAATDSEPSGRPVDAGAFLAELADVRQQLTLPVVPVPPRERPRGRPDYRDGRNRTPDRTTTGLIRGGVVGRDTTAMPRRPTGPGPGPQVNGRALYRGDEQLPPPVVIPPPKERRPPAVRRRRRAIIALIIVLLLGVGAFFGAKAFIEYKFAHVPGVAGLGEQNALQKLRSAGYHVTVGKEFDETVAKGVVITTDPTGGARLTKGHTVRVVVSSGKRHYIIPSLKGDNPDTAKQILLDLGPDIDVRDTYVREYSNCDQPSCVVKANKVTRTSPAADTSITSGVPITIYVSKGAPFVNVPNVTDDSAKDARKALSKADLRVTTVQQYSDQITAGNAIRVDPSDRARKFSDVTLTVSKGPEFVTIPSDIAQYSSAADARAELEALNLHVVEEQIGNRPNPVVLSIDPSPGTPVQVGSTVTLSTI
jgi:serine/threonine-protein kinase